MAEYLDERSSSVLKAVVESYIHTSEPVGASAISGSPGFDLSPASIRNTMAGLEKDGYLGQPHTSAGRAPTDKGYRFYAQTIVKPGALPASHVKGIRDATREREWIDVADILGSVTKTLSTLSHQASLVGVKSLGAAPIEKIEFVHINKKLVLAVLVTEAGEILRYVVKTNEEFLSEDLARMSNYFNDRFTCLTLVQIRRLLYKELQQEENRADENLSQAWQMATSLESIADEEREEKIYFDGAKNLLGGPDGVENPLNVKALLETIEDKRRLFSLLEDCLKSEGVSLLIGSESEMEELAGYTIVTHPFAGRAGLSGALGVIGLKRMNYGLMMALVSYAAGAVSLRLTSGNIKD